MSSPRRYHQHLVVGEDQGYVVLVGLELLEGGLDSSLLVYRVLEFYNCQGQAVYEDHNVRPPVLLALDDDELVYGQELVILRILEVHQMGVVSGDGAVLALVFYGHAIDEHLVKGPIVGQEGGRLGPGVFAEGFLQGIGWDPWIETAQGILEAAGEEDFLEGLTLGGGLFWGDVWAK